MNARPREARLSAWLRHLPTRYEPLERLAAGRYTEVWRADAVFDGVQRRPIAIKRMSSRVAGDAHLRAAFETEARVGMFLRHPATVRVYDARNVGGALLMVAELVDGASLREVLSRAHARHAPMPVAAALYIACEVARALDFAHTVTDATGRPLGVVHRGVAPSNVLLGLGGEVKLADFGGSDPAVYAALAARGMMGSKVGYAAPEIAAGGSGTECSDVFGVGALLWEMLTGRPLFAGSDDGETLANVARCNVAPVQSLNYKVPDAVGEVVASALARDPAARIPGAAVLFSSLARCIGALDSAVGVRDVGLMVGLHRAAIALQPRPEGSGLLDIGLLLAQQLDAFTLATAGGADADGGADPLDPIDFDGRISTGIRPYPSRS